MATILNPDYSLHLKYKYTKYMTMYVTICLIKVSNTRCRPFSNLVHSVDWNVLVINIFFLKHSIPKLPVLLIHFNFYFINLVNLYIL